MLFRSPPLARDAAGRIDADANTRIIRHLEAGGVSLLLYGGNANLYHLPLEEYDPLLAMLAATAAATTLVVPSAVATVKLSVSVCVAPSCWMSAAASRVQVSMSYQRMGADVLRPWPRWS